jgi:hypothetical protein
VKASAVDRRDEQRIGTIITACEECSRINNSTCILFLKKKEKEKVGRCTYAFRPGLFSYARIGSDIIPGTFMNTRAVRMLGISRTGKNGRYVTDGCMCVHSKLAHAAPSWSVA